MLHWLIRYKRNDATQHQHLKGPSSQLLRRRRTARGSHDVWKWARGYTLHASGQVSFLRADELYLFTSELTNCHTNRRFGVDRYGRQIQSHPRQFNPQNNAIAPPMPPPQNTAHRATVVNPYAQRPSFNTPRVATYHQNTPMRAPLTNERFSNIRAQNMGANQVRLFVTIAFQALLMIINIYIVVIYVTKVASAVRSSMNKENQVSWISYIYYIYIHISLTYIILLHI